MKFENTGRNQVLYQSMWGEDASLEGIIEPNPAKTPSSYKFKGEPENACNIIRDFYGIKNEDLFDKQYKRAVGGSGDEQRKILTLHSSSRLALLTFYNVTEENPLTLEMDGKAIAFDESAFEFKNPVIGYPSNVDVVLISHKQNVVLFLESKFAEYYLCAACKSGKISSVYVNNNTYSDCFYDSIWLSEIGIERINLPDGKFILKEQEHNYLDGFKQMICHYFGIRRRLDDKDEKKDKRYNCDPGKIYSKVLDIIKKPESKVYLGEILFDRIPYEIQGKRPPQPKDVLESYGRLYSYLAEKMNEQIDEAGLKKRFKVLDEHLKYSDILDSRKSHHAFESKILEFYGMRE